MKWAPLTLLLACSIRILHTRAALMSLTRVDQSKDPSIHGTTINGTTSSATSSVQKPAAAPTTAAIIMPKMQQFVTMDQIAEPATALSDLITSSTCSLISHDQQKITPQRAAKHLNFDVVSGADCRHMQKPDRVAMGTTKVT